MKDPLVFNVLSLLKYWLESAFAKRQPDKKVGLYCGLYIRCRHLSLPTVLDKSSIKTKL